MTEPKLSSSPSAGPRPPFLAFVSDDASRDTLKAGAQRRGWDGASVHAGTIHQAVEFLKNNPTPQTLVVEIPSAQEAAAALDALADVCAPGVKVVVVGTVNEFSFYNWLMDIGIAHYLLKPFSDAALDTALDKASAVPAAGAPASKAAQNGKVIALIGSRGGSGASTLAINLAALLSGRYGHSTALLDLDAQHGTVALSLDLEPGRGMRDVLEKPDRIDSLFIERVMIKYSDRLSILSAEEAIGEPINYHPQAAQILLAEARKQFTYILLDLPSIFNPFTVSAFMQADSVVLVSEMTLVGLRDAMRISDLMRDKLKMSPPLLVASKVGQAPKFEIAARDFEKGGGGKPAFAVPFSQEVLAAAAEGKLAVESAPGAAAVKAYDAIARHFVPDAAAPVHAAGKPRLLQRVMKGGK